MYFCQMFQLGKTIISEDILDKQFVCNIDQCKGECCVAGEAGAPITKDETQILKDIYPSIKGFLREIGQDAIKKQGVYTTNPIGEFETTLVNGKECAYAVFDNNGVAGCGIEQAYNTGVISFQKPISCHLYPIRIQEYKELTAINYHSWPICNEACTLGEKLKTPTYQFAKAALIRKFGKDWYQELDTVAHEYYDNKTKITGKNN
jgi:hypothetical protein